MAGHKRKASQALDFEEAGERSEKVVELKAWKSRLIMTGQEKDKIKQSSVYNVELILANDSNLKDTIGYNEFSGNIHLMKNSPWLNREAGQWEDSFESALLSYIEQNYQVVFDGKKLHNAIENIARKNVFNPVKDRIERQKWDGVPRVETLFVELLGVEDNLYTREVTKRWLVGSIARVYRPGVKFEIVPILDGGQGKGKSTVAAKLYTDDYFTDSLDSLGEKKDDYLQLRNNVVIELGELSSMQKTKIEQTKNFISARYDDIRLPYGRNTMKWARRCVFIGTSNDSQYLKDLTGERRFYPLPCINEPIRNVFKESDDYFLQVLAEAKILFDKGQRVYFDMGENADVEVLKMAQAYQEAAKTEDPMRDAVIKYLEMEVPADWDEAEIWGRRYYYEDYPKSKTNAQTRDSFKYPSNLLLLDSVLTMDILTVVFRKDTKDFLNGRADAEAKKIGLIVSNVPGWEKKKLYSRGRRRGYFNKRNAEKNKKRTM